MKTSILLFTHDGVGDSLVETAKQLLSSPQLTAINSYSVAYDCRPEVEVIKLKQYCKQLDNGAGVLLLTDLYGATPTNIAMQLKTEAKRWLVTGVNLAMLLKVLNYSHLEGEALVAKAYQGGRDSVLRPW